MGYKDFEILLSSGRVVRIDSLHLDRTYAGLLDGPPDAQYNERVLTRARQRVVQLWGARPTYLIKPESRLKFWTSHAYVRLPEVTYHAWLQSGPIDQVFAYSQLVVIWFGSFDARTPITELVRQTIQDLQWDQLAKGCDP